MRARLGPSRSVPRRRSSSVPRLFRPIRDPDICRSPFSIRARVRQQGTQRGRSAAPSPITNSSPRRHCFQVREPGLARVGGTYRSDPSGAVGVGRVGVAGSTKLFETHFRFSKILKSCIQKDRFYLPGFNTSLLCFLLQDMDGWSRQPRDRRHERPALVSVSLSLVRVVFVFVQERALKG